MQEFSMVAASIHIQENSQGERERERRERRGRLRWR
jgi:hypothetical protein